MGLLSECCFLGFFLFVCFYLLLFGSLVLSEKIFCDLASLFPGKCSGDSLKPLQVNYLFAIE